MNRFLTDSKSGQLTRSEKMLVWLVNADWPDEMGRERKPYGELRRPLPNISHEVIAKLQRNFPSMLRKTTEEYWPDLWDRGEESAMLVLREVRNYLLRFWLAQNDDDRDWHIHRLREYHQMVLIHPNTPRVASNLDSLPLSAEYKQHLDELNAAVTAEDAREASRWINIATKRALDEPPLRTTFERALLALQRRAQKPAKAPAYCNNPNCQKPYFLRTKKGMKACSPECSAERKQQLNRESLDRKGHRETYNAKRRVK